MVYLPDGKMKSREGKVIDADDLVVKVKEMAKNSIRERQGASVIADIELEERAMKVALGAIKFYLLKVNPTQIIHFNPEESLSFEGFTGPYCQYAYARGAKLLRDAEIKKNEKLEIDFSILGSNEELQLIQKVLESGDKIKKAGVKFNPSLVAVHIFELAKTFNQFYHSENILKAEDDIKMARLALVQIFLQTIEKELNLLGIDVLEEM
jgi:arginyl-tRNA synthetase